MITRFIDVGIAVRDLDAAIRTYSAILGSKPRLLSSNHYAYPGLKGARFYMANATISLVASDDPRSTIARFLETRGEGVNHLTLEITNIDEDISDLAGSGVEFLTKEPLDFPEGRVIFAHPRSLHGVQIAFVQSNEGVELLQQPPAASRI